MPKPRLALLCIAVLALASFAVLAGCGGGDSDSDTTASASSCKPGELDTVKDGVITVGTDKPAYPPYFVDDDPSNGKGFESAVAFAIAKQLGYSADQVEWMVEPFNSSYAPGPKKFDFDVNEISITPARAKVVAFSPPYYTAPQAIVVQKGSDLDGAKSLDAFKGASIGVQLGTTSLDAVNDQIDPDSDPKVFNDSNDVVTALKQNQVDAVVVDLPTALYLTAAQVPSATIAGQFAAPGGDRWGALMDKDSPIASCVSDAVRAIDEDGTLQKLQDKWMSQAAGAPKLN